MMDSCVFLVLILNPLLKNRNKKRTTNRATNSEFKNTNRNKCAKYTQTSDLNKLPGVLSHDVNPQLRLLSDGAALAV